MSTGIFLESEGDMLFASIEWIDDPFIEVEVREANGEGGTIRISSLTELDLFIKRLRDLYYDLKVQSEPVVTEISEDAFRFDQKKEVQS